MRTLDYLGTETIVRLTNMGFRLIKTENKEELVYEAGSIANWRRIKISPAFQQCSIVHNEDYMDSVYTSCESEQQPGYAETDWRYKSEGYVIVADLINWLESKGVSDKSRVERKKEMMSRYYERKALREKLEAAGFDIDEVKRVLG